jgi:hypothetical protein
MQRLIRSSSTVVEHKVEVTQAASGEKQLHEIEISTNYSPIVNVEDYGEKICQDILDQHGKRLVV